MITALATPEPEAERPSGVWSYISASRLNLWLRCPLAYKLVYIDGVRTPTSPSQFVGKVVHSALEVHHRHKQLGLTMPVEMLLARLVDLWGQTAAEECVQFETVAAEAACHKQAADLVVAYLAQVPASEPKPLAVEATVASGRSRRRATSVNTTPATRSWPQDFRALEETYH